MYPDFEKHIQRFYRWRLYARLHDGFVKADLTHPNKSFVRLETASERSGQPRN